MTREQLFEQIVCKQSFLCVGLDSDWARLPEGVKDSEDPQFEFNRQIIDATHNLAVAYKPNTAFYESRGLAGWQSLIKTVAYIREYYPDCLVIADAKRGDIGNTARQYAQAFFDMDAGGMDCHAVTLAPYMGQDSCEPFWSYTGRWVVLLALTSNASASDFQFIEDESGLSLFEQVISKSLLWGGTADNLMYVVGATKAEHFERVRRIAADHFLLVPGVGAQGGSLEDVARYGMNKHCGLLVNASRSIIFADSTPSFACSAQSQAFQLQSQMAGLLQSYLP